jgi:hypothetical protein
MLRSVELRMARPCFRRHSFRQAQGYGGQVAFRVSDGKLDIFQFYADKRPHRVSLFKQFSSESDATISRRFVDDMHEFFGSVT